MEHNFVNVYNFKIEPRSQEITNTAQFSYVINNTFHSFSGKIENQQLDGIQIRTNASDYYLMYRTKNAGETGYYSTVDSRSSKFAGSTKGKPMHLLQIKAYNNNGSEATDVVVMYRVHADYRWLGWICSMNNGSIMRQLKDEFNLEGELDLSQDDFAGKDGYIVSGVEIRIFRMSGSSSSSGGNTGIGTGEITPTLQYMLYNESDWYSFNRQVVNTRMDGLRIQTDPNKPYYLSYKTWNNGVGGYYPAISSTDHSFKAYAGLAGRPIQRLNIRVMRNGISMVSGVIVMYRAYVDGRWLPWVSNADPQWMDMVKSKYGLDGSLDYTSGYAGLPDHDFSGVEIRIFEDTSSGTEGFLGGEKSLTLSYVSGNSSNWHFFDRQVTNVGIDGIRIQTADTESFFLRYKTHNQGKADYYPEVNSNDRSYAAYAGSPGLPVQRLHIDAYRNSDPNTPVTSGIVVMYRVYVSGRWYPWICNAGYETGQSIMNNYSLGGSVERNDDFAGVVGRNISGVEIRVFEGTNDSFIENLHGAEAPATLSYMVNSMSNWISFDRQKVGTRMDGIRIQTDPNKPYYLLYRTWNNGRPGFYPKVNSTSTGVEDYAGYPGRPIQLLGIEVYRKNSSEKVKAGVVVMYRAYVDGRWLTWVSNADPIWMRSVQQKYGLDGGLDEDAYYAGLDNHDISGIEIRIFEENGASDGGSGQTPTGKYKIIDAPFIAQNPRWPTGCESVSTVMALNYIGNNMSVDTFIDNYLDMQPYPFDPNETFGGNPRDGGSYGCYAPVIHKALNKILPNTNYFSKGLSNVSLQELCSKYIDNNIPVIMWATMGMQSSRIKTWEYNGRTIRWVQPEHCLLLVGYDDNNYIFNDPLQHKQTYYSKASVETAYNALGKQAIVIQKEYYRPNIPPISTENIPITNLLIDIRYIENLYKKFYDEQVGGGMVLLPERAVLGITNFLRSQEYNDWEWYFTTISTINTKFVETVKSDPSGVWSRIEPYIRLENKIKLSDGDRGLLDLSHFAATLEAYLSNGLPPKFWAGWGGDLATGMHDTTINIANKIYPSSIYYGQTDREVANATIGKEGLSCNYTDFCSDFDAYKISEILKKSYSSAGWNINILSDTLQWYYTSYYNLYKDRFKWITEELNCSTDLNSLKNTIYSTMNGTLEQNGLLIMKGKNPSSEVNRYCCNAFANYIYSMLNE